MADDARPTLAAPPPPAEPGDGPRRTGAGRLEPGDAYVVANDTTQPADMRAGLKGWGRILHCDRDLKVKGALWSGDYGLLIGMALQQETGVVFATCPQAMQMLAFDPEGRPAAFTPPPRRRYGNMLFDKTGRVLVGVHSGHGEAPPEDGHGPGKLVRFDPRTGEADFFDVEIDGGRGGKHYVSNLALSPDGRTVLYVSEAGRRVCRYDIEARRQLPDFLVFPDGEEGTYGLGFTPQGEVAMATGVGAALYDPDARLIRRYDVPPIKGWTRAKVSPGGSRLYLGNFLEGLLQRRDLRTGALEAELNVGLRGSLTSVEEYAPR